MIKIQKQRLLIALAIISITVIGLCLYFRYDNNHPSTEDAYIGSNLINVASKVNGYLHAIFIKNNQKIHKGQLLFSIDNKDYQLQYLIAKESYQSQFNAMHIAKDQLNVAKLQITKDLEQLKLLQAKFLRLQKLFANNVVAKQDYEIASTNYNNAKTTLDIDKTKYQQYQNGYLYTINKVNSAKTQVEIAFTNLNNTKYYAPSDGYIANLNSLSVGELVNNGEQLFAIVDDSVWWVDANFKETKLKYLKIGQHVKVSLDMYNHKYDGIIQSISYASGGTFSLLPAQNATGNWVKVTQRFGVRIAIINNKNYPLRVGASCNVVVDATI